MSVPKKILEEALSLDPIERVELIDELLESLDKPDREIDALWSAEAESRLEAFKNQKLNAVSLDQVLEKYKE